MHSKLPTERLLLPETKVIIGFFIAGLKLETDLSEYPENFILLGGIVGLPAGAILSWVLALGKVLK